MNLTKTLGKIILFIGSFFCRKRTNDKTEKELFDLVKNLIGEGDYRDYTLSSVFKRQDGTLVFNICNRNNGKIYKCSIHLDRTLSINELDVSDINF